MGQSGQYIPSGVVAGSAGAVSFVLVVKSSEPAVSALLSGVLLGQVFPVSVYLTLLPIIFGVAIASFEELSFTWLCFGAAMLSNVSSALRAILAKKAMSKQLGENMTNTNLFAVHFRGLASDCPGGCSARMARANRACGQVSQGSQVGVWASLPKLYAEGLVWPRAGFGTGSVYDEKAPASASFNLSLNQNHWNRIAAIWQEIVD